MSVFWLAVAAFAIGTEGFVIAGLLPVIAADMQISVAAAGQLVTVYALAYAIGSPILAVTFNNLDRRNVLTLALCCFIAGNLLAVAAPTFPMLLASRVVMALGAGLCMPTAIGVAVAIAAPERQGRAAALVISGITVATVVGVPLGRLIGNQFGWRATFPWWRCLAPSRSPACCSDCRAACRAPPPRSVSASPSRGTARCSPRLRPPHSGPSAASPSSPYLSVPLHGFGFGASEISFALLIFGSAAAIGNMLGGTFADRIGPVPTAILGLAGMAMALILQSVALKFASPEHARYVLLLLIFCWGIAGWTFYPAQVASIIRIDPQASMIALSLNASAMYFGFAIGGAAGGIVLSVLGPSDLGWIGGSSVAAALALLLFRGWQQRLKLQQIAG